MSEIAEVHYSVEAYNLSHSSENKIHDDAVARDLGFSGGLVPGVEVFAYATHVALRHFGPSFLESGKMSCRFAKPVYDGRTAEVHGVANAEGGLDITVESAGVVCASGQATCGEGGEPPSISGDAFARPPKERPAADETSLAVGRQFGIHPEIVDDAALRQYLADVREQSALYGANGIVHPGQLLRLCNSALKDNVALPPWIHTGSVLQNFSPARVGEELTVQARVADNYERKGHRLVDLDCLVVANGTRVVAHVLHTAIYQLRHLAA